MSIINFGLQADLILVVFGIDRQGFAKVADKKSRLVGLLFSI
jgi:hypothetical protein